MSHLLDIRLFSDRAEVSKPGSGISKPVSVKDLVASLSESAQNALNYSRSERIRFPEGTYLTEYAGNVLNVVMYYPQREALVKHYDDGKTSDYLITMPNIVVHLTLKVTNNGAKHEVVGSYFYATEQDVNNLPTVLPGRIPGVFTNVPFPNFYENFTQCFGRNTLINTVEGGDLRIFKMFYDVIWNSPFNNDLRLYNVKFSMGRYRDWFKKLAEVHEAEKRFPYELISL